MNTNNASQYPVITAHTADREAILHRDPTMITASTNRHVLQPTRANKQRRKSRIQSIQASVDKGKHRTSSSSGEASRSKSSRPLLNKIMPNSTSSSSAKSDRSQLVDLVVEDHEAEEVERVRARKEGGPAWNEAEPKHFVRTFPEDEQEEEVREGYEPGRHEPLQPHGDEQVHNLDRPFVVGDNEDEQGGENFSGRSDEASQWQHKDYDDDTEEQQAQNPKYGSFHEERNIWGSREEEGENAGR